MLEIKIENNIEIIKNTYKEKGITYNNKDKLILAKDKNEVLGCVLFSVINNNIYLKYAEPKEDIMLLDGLVRSMLHYASENLIQNAYFEDTSPIEQLKKLNFIDTSDKNKLFMLGLLGKCENCKK